MSLNRAVKDTLANRIGELDEEIYSLGQQAQANRDTVARIEATLITLIQERRTHIDALELIIELDQ